MQYEKYHEFLKGYVDFLEEMAKGEGEKYSAMLSYDHKQMDKIVSRQQAMNMRLTQLEEQREQEQEVAGLGGLSFREILGRLAGPEQEAFRELSGRFERAVREIKYFNEKSIAFAQDGMKLLGVKDEVKAAPYTPTGKAKPAGVTGTSVFEAKI